MGKECPRVDHTRTHVHTRSRVHAAGKAMTSSRIEKIWHRHINERVPEGCSGRGTPLTLQAHGTHGSRERYVVALVHAHSHSHSHTHSGRNVHWLALFVVVVVIIIIVNDGTGAVDDITELYVSVSHET
jgi:hypothetical protein